ncbi:hypothetical protein S58_61560 [Bradyrhizobium oligotrophicum S58]|uniref:Uncharacterized protein n=1 Tax=Bradyrhizobium oligotrophicum S58 TaxID=1245469 RepID=M4ZF73_9BRAD|nr:hypothetical protein [Bradyrhizobium oligotrophicum]BAM92131.1 hypothetical protein S58_61560 [Bradyrhizobium oligotrophicum S58]
MATHTAIILIKALHTAVFVFASSCILYALRCSVTGRTAGFRLQIAIAVPSLIGVLWWLNGRECLLSSLIYRFAGDDRTQSDIFLPDAVARLIMPVST